ncbi:AtuA-related protein [Roseomonas chloroacetimidivorans]|uniref:AtuA-related protein n=1 Tax=Roseomonas chloroacetimidivorans TaxID=1766656 RepID=UPI003C774BBD
MILYELAHARAGDKGNRLNIGLFARDPAHYEHLAAQVTPERVQAHFAHRGATRVVRYDLPRLHGFNFVLDDVLEGGVNGALNLDGHGKTLSFLLLGMAIEAPPAR